MAESVTIRIHGLAGLQRALKRYADGLNKEIDRELRAAGKIVETRARSMFADISPRSAMGMRSRTRGFGRVVVEQTRRRTTGARPDFGALQMRRALIPARSAERDNVIHALENMLDRLGREAGF